MPLMLSEYGPWVQAKAKFLCLCGKTQYGFVGVGEGDYRVNPKNNTMYKIQPLRNCPICDDKKERMAKLGF